MTLKPPRKPDAFTNIRELIKLKLVEQTVPSITVAVAKNGITVWEEGFGWADKENRVPADAHTLYSLASITKPITATGLMILKEQGKLELDKPVNDYLGEQKLKAWVGDQKDATVRRVANHSSGLPLHCQFFYEDEPYIPPAFEETIRRYGNIVAVPGERYRYCNLGYGVLDYIISRISGKSYPDYIREEVLHPLGMTCAYVNIGEEHEGQHAIRYGIDGHPIPFYDFDHRGASAVYSSAHELLRFGMFHLKNHLQDQKPILTDENIDEMQRPTMKIKDNAGYGIGWEISKQTGYTVVSHDGAMGGVATQLVLVPSESLAVVVLCNSRQYALTSLIVKEILSVMLPGYKKGAKEEGNQEPTEFKPSPGVIGKWSGLIHTYKEDIPLSLLIEDSGDIHVKLGDQLTTPLDDTRFQDGYIKGSFSADIGTEDSNRLPYNLHIALKPRNKVLNGSVISISLQGKRPGNALSNWAELRKVE